MVDEVKARLTMLYSEHGNRIHRFLRDLLCDSTLAADATQETFVRAYRRLPEMRGRLAEERGRLAEGTDVPFAVLLTFAVAVLLRSARPKK